MAVQATSFRSSISVSANHHSRAAVTLTQSELGEKSVPIENTVALWLFRLVVLFCLENDGCPAGIFPLAFSDMPRSCIGTASSTETSTEEETDGVREFCLDGDDCDGVGWRLSSSSESSSSPMANAVLSSGTLLSVGVLLLAGLRALSLELVRRTRAGLAGEPGSPEAAFLRSLSRSISACPLFKVKVRSASHRFFDRNTAEINCGFSVKNLTR